MLNFALTGNDKSKVTSTEYGNNTNPVLKTGLTRTSDKINNIYDLGGNLYEWTSEAYGTSWRQRQGFSRGPFARTAVQRLNATTAVRLIATERFL